MNYRKLWKISTSKVMRKMIVGITTIIYIIAEYTNLESRSYYTNEKNTKDYVWKEI